MLLYGRAPNCIIPICIQDGGGSEEPTEAYWKYVEESDGQHTHLRRVPGRYTLEGKSVLLVDFGERICSGPSQSLHPQIRLSDLIVVQQIAAHSFKFDLTVLKDVRPVAQGKRELHFLRHEKDGKSLFSEDLQRIENV